jgi:hypothetical protein
VVRQTVSDRSRRKTDQGIIDNNVQNLLGVGAREGSEPAFVLATQSGDETGGKSHGRNPLSPATVNQ